MEPFPRTLPMQCAPFQRGTKIANSMRAISKTSGKARGSNKPVSFWASRGRRILARQGQHFFFLSACAPHKHIRSRFPNCRHVTGFPQVPSASHSGGGGSCAYFILTSREVNKKGQPVQLKASVQSGPLGPRRASGHPWKSNWTNVRA